LHQEANNNWEPPRLRNPKRPLALESGVFALRLGAYEVARWDTAMDEPLELPRYHDKRVGAHIPGQGDSEEILPVLKRATALPEFAGNARVGLSFDRRRCQTRKTQRLHAVGAARTAEELAQEEELGKFSVASELADVAVEPDRLPDVLHCRVGRKPVDHRRPGDPLRLGQALPGIQLFLEQSLQQGHGRLRELCSDICNVLVELRKLGGIASCGYRILDSMIDEGPDVAALGLRLQLGGEARRTLAAVGEGEKLPPVGRPEAGRSAALPRRVCGARVFEQLGNNVAEQERGAKAERVETCISPPGERSAAARACFRTGGVEDNCFCAPSLQHFAGRAMDHTGRLTAFERGQ